MLIHVVTNNGDVEEEDVPDGGKRTAGPLLTVNARPTSGANPQSMAVRHVRIDRGGTPERFLILADEAEEFLNH